MSSDPQSLTLQSLDLAWAVRLASIVGVPTEAYALNGIARLPVVVDGRTRAFGTLTDEQAASLVFANRTAWRAVECTVERIAQERRGR